MKTGAEKIKAANAKKQESKHPRDFWQNTPFARFLARAKAGKAASLAMSPTSQ
jgi:hypothetical protein